MNKLVILLLALAALCLRCDGVVFSRCELVRELRRQNFLETELRDWVCIIEQESQSSTSLVRDALWGLFQISQEAWCSTGSSPEMGCNVKCEDLITDDITKASNCAKLIKYQEGFNVWGDWVTKCKGKPLPDISMC